MSVHWAESVDARMVNYGEVNWARKADAIISQSQSQTMV